MSSQPFTCRHTGAVSPKRSLVRPDLDLDEQRYAVRVHKANAMQTALMKDFESTICSRENHHQFLVAMLHEVQRFHVVHNNLRIPERALELMAEHIAIEMNTAEEDPYADCLAYLSHLHPYSRNFYQTAVQMLADERKRLALDESQRSIGGLSDE